MSTKKKKKKNSSVYPHLHVLRLVPKAKTSILNQVLDPYYYTPFVYRWPMWLIKYRPLLLPMKYPGNHCRVVSGRKVSALKVYSYSRLPDRQTRFLDNGFPRLLWLKCGSTIGVSLGKFHPERLELGKTGQFRNGDIIGESIHWIECIR